MPETTTETKVNESVQRHMIADYLNVGTAEAPKWVLMGTGFTSLDENPNAQTKERKFICDASSSKTTSSYQTQFPFNAEYMTSEEAIDKLYKIARNQLTGGKAEVDYVRTELFDECEPKVDNTHPARKFRCAVEVSTIGDNDGVIELSGNLNNIGSFIPGSFNTKTATFTADGETTPEA